jgi:uncharacterized protein YutE (UPF0331/DUF86 family)
MTRGRPDASVLRRHLAALRSAIDTLGRFRGQPVDALRSDRERLWIAERGLQLCAQNALDVAAHLAASAGLDVPDYATAIDRLRELEILPADFAARFRSVAGFRNVIVHGYLDVDPDQVHLLLNERLGDFLEFARRVEAHLAALGKD